MRGRSHTRTEQGASDVVWVHPGAQTRGRGGVAARAAVALLVVGLAGCQELSDVWATTSGEEQPSAEEGVRKVRDPSANHAPEPRAEPVAPRPAPTPPTRSAAAAPAGQREGYATFDSTSPAGRLRALFDRRIACADDACRKKILDQIQRDSALLLPGIAELVSRQPEAIIVEAVRLAGLFRHVGSAEALGRAALVGSGPVRAEAVWALGQIGDPRGLESLDRISRLDNPLDVISGICRAVGAIGRPEGAPILDRLYSAADPLGRGECVQAAGKIGSIEVMPMLRRAAVDPEDGVRQDARRALEGIPGKEAKQLLRKIRAR
jgi:hypothetical protein